MPQGTAAVLTGKPLSSTGGITTAPLGTTLPTDAMTKLSDAFKRLGFVDEDGVTRTVDASDDKIKAWGGSTVAVVRSDFSVSYTFKLLESSNADVLKALYGESNVTVTEPVKGQHNGRVSIAQNERMVPKAAYTLEILDQRTFIREVIPTGQLTISDDVQFVHSGVISYSVTIEGLPDDNGNCAYTYQDTAESDSAARTIKDTLTGGATTPAPNKS